MAIVKTDWGQYRDANSVIPPDIFFSVPRSSDNDEENIDLEVDKNNLIGAHKLLLAGSSEVFRANFFGLMKMNGEVMVVKETTKEAFATLINFIYWPLGKEIFSLKHITNLEELCDIVEISERYQVPDLVQIAKETIQTFEITEKNVIFSATVAEKYKVFDGIEEILNNKNMEVLERTMKSAADVFALMSDTKARYTDRGLNVLSNLGEMMQARMEDGPWGRKTIIFSKYEEHQITQNAVLTTIPRLEKHWRITFDLKPTEYNSNTTNNGYFGSALRLKKGTDSIMSFFFQSNTTSVGCTSDHWTTASCSVDILPKIGVWTTFDVVNEELEEGKCTLTVFIGGKQVFKEEKDGSRAVTDVTVTSASAPNGQNKVANGFIRGLTIMTKK